MDIYTFQTGDWDSPHCVGPPIPFHSILFFGRGRGRGGRATAKPTDRRHSSADGFAVRMKRTKAGQDCVILFHVFGGEMATAKIQTVKGLRAEIFLRFLRKNTTRPLTVWIGKTDIKQGLFLVMRCAIYYN